MDFIIHLWIPILVSAVVVWIASAAAWMAVHHHDKDRKALPNEQQFIDTIKAMNIPPGNYGFPDFQQCKGKTKDQKKAMYDEMQKHPMGMLNVWGPISMGGNMVGTFVFNIVVSVLIAYIGWSALAHGPASVTIPGAGTVTGPSMFWKVFQVLGTAGILAYCCASYPNDIWFQKSRRAMVMNTIDGIVYGLITGAIFGWLWPHG